MPGDADIASIAALLADPTRAAMLLVLSDGRAFTASELAKSQENFVARYTIMLISRLKNTSGQESSCAGVSESKKRWLLAKHYFCGQ